ncbi:hypothetical protein B0H10DRAFT_2440235 [Mycena sp. CBHHK59/15]|nr:hypothetical protein B0H10DRAFT_2440235 [Mycena sp. CBHHK59/15]
MRPPTTPAEGRHAERVPVLESRHESRVRDAPDNPQNGMRSVFRIAPAKVYASALAPAIPEPHYTMRIPLIIAASLRPITARLAADPRRVPFLPRSQHEAANTTSTPTIESRSRRCGSAYPVRWYTDRATISDESCFKRGGVAAGGTPRFIRSLPSRLVSSARENTRNTINQRRKHVDGTHARAPRPSGATASTSSQPPHAGGRCTTPKAQLAVYAPPTEGASPGPGHPTPPPPREPRLPPVYAANDVSGLAAHATRHPDTTRTRPTPHKRRGGLKSHVTRRYPGVIPRSARRTRERLASADTVDRSKAKCDCIQDSARYSAIGRAHEWGRQTTAGSIPPNEHEEYDMRKLQRSVDWSHEPPKAPSFIASRTASPQHLFAAA